MKFGFNFGSLSKGGGGVASGPIPNGCITQGTNGTKYGYDSSIPIGANTPDTIAATSQFIYANYWMADGTFIVQIGDAGNEQIPDVEFIFTVINGTLLQYVWDGVKYQATNLTLAAQLISDSVLDEDVCYTALPILQKMISYDMNITPEPAVLGPNVIVNGTFDDDTDWETDYYGNGWAISGGVAYTTNTALAGIRQVGNLPINSDVEMTFEVIASEPASEIRICKDTISFYIDYTHYNVGVHTVYFTTVSISDSSDIVIFSKNGEITIDNVSVKKVITPAQDTLINNTSYAPHFNAPVIDATQNGPGSILVDGYTEIDTGFKPNISQYSIEETVTGDLANEGLELVTNGTFDTTVDNFNVSIGTLEHDAANGGQAKLTLPSGYINFYSDAITLEIGNTYRLSVKRVGDGLGNPAAYPRWALSTSTSNIVGYTHESNLADGETSFADFVAIAETNYVMIRLATNTDDVYYFDDISLKEVLAPTQRTEQRLLTHEDNVLGDELVVDGGFDVGTVPAQWGGIGTLTIEDNKLKATKGVAGSNKFVAMTIPVVSGTSYVIKVGILENPTGNRLAMIMYVDDVEIYRQDSYSGDNPDFQSHLFTANATGDFKLTYNYLEPNGSFIYLDDVSMRPIETENKYYIDGIEQSTVPTLPNPVNYINLNDTAVIGYPDTIDSREADFNVYTTVRTVAEVLADYNAWVLEYQDALTDGNGDYLTDGYGRYLYT